jgi:release factor glutamine methyltransferase
VTRAAALRALAARLKRAGLDSSERDAETLLLHVLGVPRAALWAEGGEALTPAEAESLEALARAREGRTPIQILLGEIPFHEVTLRVEAGVFIPRPETEGLVEAVIGELSGGPPGTRGPTGGPSSGTFLELGTGTGAISVALLHALPGWRAVAVDRSPPALRLAARNAARNGVAERLVLQPADFREADFSPPGAPFDAVVSNPPYVRSGDIDSLPPEVSRHDPREALDGGADGLDSLRRMASGLPRWLGPGGLVALEIGADQADDAVGMMRPLVPDVRVRPDLAGRPRHLIGRFRGRDAT